MEEITSRKNPLIQHIKRLGAERKARREAGEYLCLGDKLSNVREMARDYERVGEALWDQFNQKDKTQHEWYYRSMYAILAEAFPDATAVEERGGLIDGIFR